MDPVVALQHLGGTARTADLLRLCSRRALQAALTSGDVERVARGRYALPTVSRAERAAAAAPGVLAGVSAAQAYGWATLHRREDAVVAVLPGQRVDPRPGVVYVRRPLDADERRQNRTSPVRTLVDCATFLPFVDALAVADSALRDGTVLPEELAHAAVEFHGTGAADLRRVAKYSDGRAANAFESGLRAHLVLAGLTTFRPQHVITAPGFFAQVDLADPDRQVAIEADGFAVHGDRRRLAVDLRRHDELTALGWVTLRFAWEHVMFSSEWVVATIRVVLAGRRVRPRPRTGRRHDPGVRDARTA